jgi:predicted N-acetyltransferase YhbS
LYKLIVARRYAARSLGAMITNWACDKAARFGYPWLRLDAWPTNPRLLDYYRNQGFTHVHTVHVPGRDTGVLMQRPAKITPTPGLTEEMTEAISPADQ